MLYDCFEVPVLKPACLCPAFSSHAYMTANESVFLGTRRGKIKSHDVDTCGDVLIVDSYDFDCISLGINQRPNWCAAKRVTES